MHGGDIYNNSVDIDFSVNLNPYVTKELTRIKEEAAAEGIKASGVYPDPDQVAVRRALAKAEHVDMGCVFAGCGASQLIMAAVHAIAPSAAVLTKPCFGGYEYALKSARVRRIKRYPLTEENGFELTEGVLEALTEDIDLLFLADPANPTGKNIDDDLLVKILEKTDRLGIKVILDQSFFMLSDKYLKCTDEYASKLISRYQNLYIIRSYTKCFALPGIRMGYVISCENNVSFLRSFLPEWNLPAVSETHMRRLAAYATDSDFFTESVRYISNERDFLMSALSGLRFPVFGANTNFLLIKSEENIYEKLISERILIRRCDDFFGPEKNFFRTAVRCHEDNIRLIDKLGSRTKI